jgi:hypothetical protein
MPNDDQLAYAPVVHRSALTASQIRGAFCFGMQAHQNNRQWLSGSVALQRSQKPGVQRHALSYGAAVYLSQRAGWSNLEAFE